MPVAVEPNNLSKSAMALYAGFAPPQLRRWNQINRRVFQVLLIAPLLIVWLSAYTNIDLILADAVFDRAHGNFPWRHVWLAEVFSHVLLKRMLGGLAVAVISVTAWDLVFPGRWSWLQRFQMRVVALSAIIVPAIIAILKQASSSHCPWDLARYGGTEPYIRLLEAIPAGIAPGHCMPAGHVSSALWLISLTVFLLPKRPRAAVLALSLLLGFSFAVGWLQQLRGAHFLTHTLWSMWISSVIVFALFKLLDRRSYSR